jgi:hypothetical protein
MADLLATAGSLPSDATQSFLLSERLFDHG